MSKKKVTPAMLRARAIRSLGVGKKLSVSPMPEFSPATRNREICSFTDTLSMSHQGFFITPFMSVVANDNGSCELVIINQGNSFDVLVRRDGKYSKRTLCQKDHVTIKKGDAVAIRGWGQINLTYVITRSGKVVPCRR